MPPKPIMPGSLLTAFQRQVASRGDRPAVIYEGRALSYQTLNQRANQFARVLKSYGGHQGDRIAVTLDRSPATFIVLLGVLKAGCAYVPLDPNLPALRRRAIATEARAPILVASHEEFVLEEFEGPVIVLPRIEPELATARAEDLDVEDTGACCVLFTSGTTGRPKGVVVPDRAILNHASWMWQTYPFRDEDLTLVHRSCTYMAATWDYFGPLLGGAAALIAPGHTTADPADLIRLCVEHGVSHASGSPGFWRAILDRPRAHLDAWNTLRLGTTSGEGLPVGIVADWRRVFPQATLLNVYGITEAVRPAVYDTRHWTEADTRVPIGAPLPNVAMCVVDEHGVPVEHGGVGEIMVAGACVTDGYYERPQLTGRRFTQDPSGKYETAFRTGDRGRIRPDGLFEVLGRVDHQIKIRGYRVELEEVEATLHLCPLVRQAVVDAREDASGQNRLVAHVVAAHGDSFEPSDVRGFMQSRLPDYMIPAQFVLVDEIPLTSSGKPDRLTLSTLDAAASSRCESEIGSPPTATEDALARIWSDVIGVPAVRRADSFLDLGGHSLMAMQIASRVLLAFGIELPLESFFPNPTLGVMAATIDALRSPADQVR